MPDCDKILCVGGKFGVSLVEAKLCTIESGDPIINSVHNYVYISWTRYIYIHHIIKEMKDGEL